MNAIRQFWRDFARFVKGWRSRRSRPAPDRTIGDLKLAYAKARRAKRGQGAAFRALRDARHAALARELQR